MRWIPIAVVLAASAVPADEVRLRDGRVLIGAVSRSADRLVVATRGGDVEVDAADVVSHRTDGELRRALRGLRKAGGDDAFARLQVARQARDWRLCDETWESCDRLVEALESVAPREPVDRLARRFLASLEPELLTDAQLQADPVRRARALIHCARSGAGAGRCAAVAAALAALDGADDELLRQARRGLLVEQRIAACEALLRRGGDGDRRAAFLQMLIDDERVARQRIATLAGRLAPTRDALGFVAPAFLSDSPPLRMQAAEVVGALGDVELGAPLLAAVGPYAGTPRADGERIGVRAHMAVTLQTSYIRDFDVEIAQAAAVANPVVDRVTSGVVLDVKVAAVVSMRVPIERSYRRALAALLGSDPGRDPAAWAAAVAARN